MLNLVQAYTLAQLVTVGTEIHPALIAAISIWGMLLVQLVLLATSGARTFAVSSPDIVFALLARQVVKHIHATFGSSDASGVSMTTALSVLACCVLTSTLGLVFLAISAAKMADLIHFMPLGVVAGILGAVGLQVVFESLSVASGFEVDGLAGARSVVLLRPWQCAAAALFAIMGELLVHRFNAAFSSLTLVPLTLFCFYGFKSIGGIDRAELVREGWLCPQLNGLTLSELFDLVVSLPFQYTTTMLATLPSPILLASYAFVCCLNLVYKVRAVEAMVNEARPAFSINSNRELRFTGWANVVTGLVGGTLANHSVFNLKALRSKDADSRIVAAVTCSTLLTGVVLAFGIPLANILPRFILGGLLTMLGVQSCKVWLWDQRYKLDTSDLVVLAAIIFAAVCIDLAAAVFVGLLAAVCMSHTRESSLNALRYHLCASSYRPRVSRPLAVQSFLERHSSAVHLLGMEGFLFEGTTIRLALYIERLVERIPELRFVILDLEQVQGILPNACESLGRLRDNMRAHDREARVELLVASSDPEWLPRLLAHAGADIASALHPSVDAAVEWCEHELLMQGSPQSGGLVGPQLPSPAVASSSDAAPHLPAGNRARHTPVPSDSLGQASMGASVLEAPPLEVKRYFLNSSSGNFPYAPSVLPSSISWGQLQSFGSRLPLKEGQKLTIQGRCTRILVVVPSMGVDVAVSVDVGHADGPLLLARMHHGGVFGAEGALLGLPAIATATCNRCGADAIALDAVQLDEMRAAHPRLAESLLAAALQQKQDILWMVARRAAVLRGGGWRGPNFDAAAAPRHLLEKNASGASHSRVPIQGCDSEQSLPDGFGRIQLKHSSNSGGADKSSAQTPASTTSSASVKLGFWEATSARVGELVRRVQDWSVSRAVLLEEPVPTDVETAASVGTFRLRRSTVGVVG